MKIVGVVLTLMALLSSALLAAEVMGEMGSPETNDPVRVLKLSVRGQVPLLVAEDRDLIYGRSDSGVYSLFKSGDPVRGTELLYPGNPDTGATFFACSGCKKQVGYAQQINYKSRKRFLGKTVERMWNIGVVGYPSEVSTDVRSWRMSDKSDLNDSSLMVAFDVGNKSVLFRYDESEDRWDTLEIEKTYRTIFVHGSVTEKSVKILTFGAQNDPSARLNEWTFGGNLRFISEWSGSIEDEPVRYSSYSGFYVFETSDKSQIAILNRGPLNQDYFLKLALDQGAEKYSVQKLKSLGQLGSGAQLVRLADDRFILDLGGRGQEIGVLNIDPLSWTFENGSVDIGEDIGSLEDSAHLRLIAGDAGQIFAAVSSHMTVYLFKLR